MQAGFDFSVDLNPERKEPDFYIMPVYIFQEGHELIITETLQHLREILPIKEYNSFLAGLNSFFDKYNWNGHDLNKICFCIKENKIQKLHTLLQVVAAYAQIPTKPSFLSKPFARLVTLYGMLKTSHRKNPAPWKYAKLTEEIIPAMHDHGSFGYPGGMKAEFLMEEEVQAV